MMHLSWPFPVKRRDLAPALRASYLDAARALAPTLASDEVLDAVMLPLAGWLADGARPLVVGISGAQGTGKTSVTALLKLVLTEGFSLRVAAFSLDDFYLTQAQRHELASCVHPLFATRGVPGTHDLALLLNVLDRLRTAEVGAALDIPRFDKLADERCPLDAWQRVTGPFDIVLFEGWCLGAPPQPTELLEEAVNDLERNQDPQGIWRKRVNGELAAAYGQMFERLDHVIYLQAPDMTQVCQWRLAQEAQTYGQAGLAKNASRSAIASFVAYFERVTRWMMERMPETAALTLVFDEQHRLKAVQGPKARRPTR